MEYNINKLAEAYASRISTLDKTIKFEKNANFNLNAYNDLEYLLALKNIEIDYERIDDSEVYEKFLKGE